MDMNFPHADIGEWQLDKPAQEQVHNMRTLLSHAMAKQISSPTYKQMMLRQREAKGQPVGNDAIISNMIRYFSGNKAATPNGSFHPATAAFLAECFDTEEKGKNHIYQTVSAIGKSARANAGVATASNEND